jgi:uroporphyrinogen-III decarboxylase
MLLLDTMMGKEVPRAPSIPKIWIDLAANLLHRDYSVFFNDPAFAMQTIIEAAIDCKCDGARVFLFPSREVKKEGNIYYHLGGVNTLSFINRPPENIRTEAERCIKEGFTRGHFVVGSGCVVPRTARREALLALAEASVNMGVS